MTVKTTDKKYDLRFEECVQKSVSYANNTMRTWKVE